MAGMIGVDPHKGSHAVVALDQDERPLGELRVRSSAGQLERLVEWASPLGERTWSIERAGGLGYLLAQQLVAAGERVVDVQPKLAARVRLLATGTNKNDPNDARSVAVAALRSAAPEVRVEDHAKVMKVWAKRHRDLSRHRTRLASRLHAVLCELTPGGFTGEISAAQATRVLDGLEPAGAVAAARHAVAVELVADMRRLDDQLRDAKQRIVTAVTASKRLSPSCSGSVRSLPPSSSATSAMCPASPAVTPSLPTTAPHRSRSPRGPGARPSGCRGAATEEGFAVGLLIVVAGIAAVAGFLLQPDGQPAAHLHQHTFRQPCIGDGAHPTTTSRARCRLAARERAERTNMVRSSRPLRRPYITATPRPSSATGPTSARPPTASVTSAGP
jgi:hypothetical protein